MLGGSPLPDQLQPPYLLHSPPSLLTPRLAVVFLLPAGGKVCQGLPTIGPYPTTPLSSLAVNRTSSGCIVYGCLVFVRKRWFISQGRFNSQPIRPVGIHMSSSAAEKYQKYFRTGNGNEA